MLSPAITKCTDLRTLLARRVSSTIQGHSKCGKKKMDTPQGPESAVFVISLSTVCTWNVTFNAVVRVRLWHRRLTDWQKDNVEQRQTGNDKICFTKLNQRWPLIDSFLHIQICHNFYSFESIKLMLIYVVEVVYAKSEPKFFFQIRVTWLIFRRSKYGDQKLWNDRKTSKTRKSWRSMHFYGAWNCACDDFWWPTLEKK